MPIDYIVERILTPAPEDCCVIPCRVPGISNGDPALASVATVGLNHRDTACMKIHSPKGECQLDEAGAKASWEDSKQYFEKGKPYKFFDPLEQILVQCGVSYGGRYAPDGSHSDICHPSTACHIDLVKWPTKPLWGRLRKRAKDRLLEQDAPFFKRLLIENPNIKLLLANGAGVINALAGAFCVTFKEADVPPIQFSRKSAPLYTSEVEGCAVVGWRPNLQSDFGVYGVNNEGKRELAQRVGEIAREWEILHSLG